jgi:succinyl-diaminopimelate desuccinylase
MGAEGEAMTACVVGEPTCPTVMGEMIKIGRRGSLTARVTAKGKQGHAAYPHRAANPLPVLVAFLNAAATHELDRGSDHFDPSTLALTTIDVGNPASNVIPAVARATLNIRFNDLHSGAALSDWLRKLALAHSTDTGVTLDLDISISGESFLTQPGPLSDLVARAVEAECGIAPVLSTTGGTSDARFITRHCPVVEFGLVGTSMHQVDEYAVVDQIHTLKAVYTRVLQGFFA